MRNKESTLPNLMCGQVEFGGTVYNCIYVTMLCLQVKLGMNIGVTLNMDDRTLSFDLDGCFLGVAFSMLPQCHLYPAISAVFGNSEISLVYQGTPLAG